VVRKGKKRPLNNATGSMGMNGSSHKGATRGNGRISGGTGNDRDLGGKGRMQEEEGGLFSWEIRK